MRLAEADELAEVFSRVKEWSPDLRIALVKRILESLRLAESGLHDTAHAPPRGLSAEEARALFQADRPAPDDETIKRWIDEYRTEKYG